MALVFPSFDGAKFGFCFLEWIFFDSLCLMPLFWMMFPNLLGIRVKRYGFSGSKGFVKANGRFLAWCQVVKSGIDSMPDAMKIACCFREDFR